MSPRRVSKYPRIIWNGGREKEPEKAQENSLSTSPLYLHTELQLPIPNLGYLNPQHHLAEPPRLFSSMDLLPEGSGSAPSRVDVVKAALAQEEMEPPCPCLWLLLENLGKQGPAEQEKAP